MFQWAGEEGLSWIGFAASPTPFPSFLAGLNSLYKALPLKVLTTGFNVDSELEQKFLSKRRHDFAILPPRKEVEFPSHSNEDSMKVTNK